MSCDSYNGSIMRYFDGNIDHAERLGLEQHLETCEDCRRDFEQMDSILNAIGGECAIEPPEDFEQQVMDKIRMMYPIQSKKPNILFIAMYGFAAMMLFTVCSILSYSIMGISLVKLFSGIAGNYISTSEVIDMVYFNVQSVAVSVFETVMAYVDIAVSLVSEHYYITVLIGVILFALQWILVTVVKQGNVEFNRAKSQ
ncbi:putative zinc finger protein [Anaerobacterium chartisolvens]|uniref:Anti-sigma-W factor RsiW n=1 Tax=Anaerobacterium chartisolvens TaxID=1297424 RepID=A0A369AZD4_9FIRM|nr:zf-HC2 domain-containing protein [Anaerobacterium chartisolvens]RCX13547.1 putative zinc finger protein [Anaerobacterium chartisolvens]